MLWRVEVDQQDLRRQVRALSREADGKELRRDLVSALKTAVEPFAQQARGSILSMSSQGFSSPSLRTAVASAVKVEVRLGGSRAGVFVVAGKAGMPRGFRNAPKRLNSRGWRRQVFGSGEWVNQVGKPGWFDDTMKRADKAAERAAKNAMDNVADRIQQRTHN
jgi:hypothetical protein